MRGRIPRTVAAVKRWRWASRSRKRTRRPHDGGAKTQRDEHRGDVGGRTARAPLEAKGFRLPFRLLTGLAQKEKRKRAGREAGSRGGMDLIVMLAPMEDCT